MTALMIPNRPDYTRRIYWTVNIALLILVPVLCVLAWNIAHQGKTDVERREHAEYCALWDYGEPDLPKDCPKPVPSVDDVLNGD
jgi:hypothetical protein